MSWFEGRTAVVTGGGTAGIGRATAARLATEGAHVFISGRREAELDEAVGVIGPNVTAVPGDITVPADLDRLYAAVADRGRGLDVLVANAAAASFATLDTIAEEEFYRIFDVNVKGTLFTVRKALPLLNEGSSVVVTGSTTADRGVASMGAYSASKAAVRSLVRTWAVELADRGIRVNAVTPGPTDTSGVTELVGAENVEAYKSAQGAQMLLGRVARPDEVAAAITFLASPESSFVLGAELYVDGGANQV
ncbi:SDR family NAD(P)-dependent oxidoreductase [Pseudonocardia sp. ICBG1293]|uniref:SDR family NAD(P)-dependent oxidoreductase n=1 Tax=Pseudonocardia sp. ICBG1293 TaxID=2844382 RepID=UPI001CCBDC10|nr:SDR family oxidoreductase [Pseudonocardia sp. ICBG1293]